MLIMDYKSPNRFPWQDAKSSPSDSTTFSLMVPSTCASLYSFSNKDDFFESKYIVDEGPNRVASRLIQLCDEFDKELSPHDCRYCHILSLLLRLLSWLI